MTYREALTFLNEIKPDLHIVNYGEGVRTEAGQIFRRYGRDHKLSFCDAISFVVITTLLDNVSSLAFDRDFRALGLPVIP
jgi:predicted nucleic acid-binding protein